MYTAKIDLGSVFSHYLSYYLRITYTYILCLNNTQHHSFPTVPPYTCYHFPILIIFLSFLPLFFLPLLFLFIFFFFPSFIFYIFTYLFINNRHVYIRLSLPALQFTSKTQGSCSFCHTSIGIFKPLVVSWPFSFQVCSKAKAQVFTLVRHAFC